MRVLEVNFCVVLKNVYSVVATFDLVQNFELAFHLSKLRTASGNLF